nr:IS607 family transposase [Trinickia symbiotica]
MTNERRTVACARVASQDQAGGLGRQKERLEQYCKEQGWSFELLSDIGSGMNCHKPGLNRLLRDILASHVGRLVITRKDRLPRFGAEWVFAVCEAKQVEIMILNEGEDTTFEEDLADDVQELMAIFSTSS